MTSEPKIEFPCDYLIRIIGESRDGFRDDVLKIVRDQGVVLAALPVSVQPSRDGSYCSVRVTIVATGEDQLKALHAALMAEPAVRMVL
ncbi:MAG: YbeD family protein [Pseudomonadales bacterium]